MYWKITGNENGVLSDYLNITPRDNKILLPSEKTEKFRFSVHHQLAYFGGAGVELDIVGIAQLAACFNIYYFLAPKIFKSANHINHPFEQVMTGFVVL